MCKACRSESDRASNRRKAQRWREAHPEQWQAVQARHNVKRQADPEHRRRKREYEVLRNYGLEPEAFRALVAAQDGRCAICRRPPRGKPNGKAREDVTARLHVDHCHTTGRVRGLLCGNCNTMIGLANEDRAVLLAAVEYLTEGAL